MTTCPYCSHAADTGSRVCKRCGRALIQRCLACAEDIPVLSPVCPLCKTPQTAPALVPVPGAGAPVGEDRNVVLTLLLSFLTCGIYSLIVRYQLGTELNAHARRTLLSPGVDILLAFLTCGFWLIYADYKYGQTLKEICEEERGPIQDVSVVCLVLTLFGFGIVSVLILQNEANTHWRRHTGQP
jgi:hypothetical protein